MWKYDIHTVDTHNPYTVKQRKVVEGFNRSNSVLMFHVNDAPWIFLMIRSSHNFFVHEISLKNLKVAEPVFTNDNNHD